MRPGISPPYSPSGRPGFARPLGAEKEAERMHNTATRKVAALLLTALMTAATVSGVAPAVTDTVGDEQAGVRVASSPTSREST